MALPRLATDGQLQDILDGAVRTLETVGFLYQDDELRQRVVAVGGTDGPQGQVLIPRRLVDEVLAPRRADPEGPPARGGRGEGPYAGIGCQIAQFYLDPDTGKRVPASRALLAELVRFGHVWQQGGVGPVLLCRDVPPPVEPLEGVLTIARHTDRVGDGYVHFAEQVPYLAELGRILRDDHRAFLGMCVFMVTPLRMDRRACRLLMELMARGVPPWLGTQPAAGVSAPVTVPGAVVLATAEILAGWVAAFSLDPEARPGAGICSGVLDMKTANVSYCAPEAMLQDLLCVELFRELCGGRVNVAGGAGYTDAKVPGMQKGFELAFEALTTHAHTGHGPWTGSGLLDSGKTFSPVQFILDDEFGRYLGWFAGGAEFGEDALALDSILAVGTGLHGNHLSTDHTLAHWRSLYQPRLLDRACYREGEAPGQAEQRLLAAAADRFREVRAAYEPASVPAEQLAAAERVIEGAYKELCGG